MEPEKQTPEHKWLEQLVGEWEFESIAEMGPDQPPMKTAGTERTRKIGDLWVVGEMEQVHEGHTHLSLMTLGYDAKASKFVGSFIASMMSYFWSYQGSLSGNILTLDADGPSFTGEGLAKYQDIIEVRGPNERTLSSQTFMDGTWKPFLKMTYKRIK